jgi:hypothetical protein
MTDGWKAYRAAAAVYMFVSAMLHMANGLSWQHVQNHSALNTYAMPAPGLGQRVDPPGHCALGRHMVHSESKELNEKYPFTHGIPAGRQAGQQRV